MARINVEDSIYTDLRFYKLLSLLDYDADRAIGCLVRAWRVGQPIWKETKLGIPLDVWKTQQLRNEIIECGLARIEGDRVWLNGANEAFKFLEEFENRQSKGGKARANSAPRNERGQFVKEDKPSKPSDGPATVQLSSLTSPSYSSSSSCSYSNTKINTYTPTAEPERADAVPETAGAVSKFPPLVKIWNENRGTLPEVKSLSSKRTRLITARWKGTSDASIWEGRVRRMAASAFCCGANQTGWRANFDFFLKEDVLTRLDEGQYDNRKPFSAPNEKVMDEFDRQWKEEQRKKEEQRIREIEGW